jgi:hypothetical protein
MNIPMGERMPDDVVNTFRNLLFRMPAPKESDTKE